MLQDTGEAPHWQDRVPGSRVLGPFTRDRKAVLVRADAPELARSLDRWLLASERRGLLGDLRYEHLGAAGPRTAAPLAALLAAIDERLSLMPYVAEAKRATSSAIADPAREQRVLAAARERVEAACAERGLEPRMAPCSVRREEVRGLFLSLIGAAKDVQRRVLAGPPDPDKARDLDGEIRPALLRIGDRLAWLAVRLPSSLERNSVRARTRRALERHDLRAARVMQIADAIVALASRPSICVRECRADESWVTSRRRHVL